MLTIPIDILFIIIWLSHGDEIYWMYIFLTLNKLIKIFLLYETQASSFGFTLTLYFAFLQGIFVLWISVWITQYIHQSKQLENGSLELDKLNIKILSLLEEISGFKKNIESKERDVHMKNRYIAVLTHDLRNMILAYIYI